MHCKDLESALGSHGIEALSTEAREHLRSCPSCQGFLADLETIVAVAKTIPAEAEPPVRVWVSLRAQLEAASSETGGRDLAMQSPEPDIGDIPGEQRIGLLPVGAIVIEYLALRALADTAAAARSPRRIVVDPVRRIGDH